MSRFFATIAFHRAGSTSAMLVSMLISILGLFLKAERERMRSSLYGIPHVKLKEDLFNNKITREEKNVLLLEPPRALENVAGRIELLIGLPRAFAKTVVG